MGKRADILNLAKLSLCCVPHLDYGVVVRANQLLKVRGESLSVDLGGRPGAAHALGDIEDDASETVFVNEDLLVVGNLAQLGYIGEVVGQRALERAAKERRARVVVGHCGVGGCLPQSRFAVLGCKMVKLVVIVVV